MSNHDSGNSDIGAFLAGFVIGGLVGAATALVLAPQSGEETRAQLASRSEELRRAGGERIHQYREMADSALGDAKVRLHETTEQVQERARIVLDEGRSRIADVSESVKERVTQAKDEIAARVQRDEPSQEGDAPTTA
jgi:gas vesicle protein